MKRSRKSHRVSWAPGSKLCQVRLFASEASPSEIGKEAQGLWALQSSKDKQSNDLPPGFETSYLCNPIKGNVPRIQWKCPPKFVLRHDWHVVTGEESQEVEVQNQREMRLLEAVYPRPSAIPPSPSLSPGIEDESYDDSLTPVIPLIPIEEEEASADMPDNSSEPTKPPIASEPPLLQVLSGIPNSSKCNLPAIPVEKTALGLLPDNGADRIAAASVALAAIMKSNEQGSLIDTNLLAKIFSDPKMIEKLLNENDPITIPETRSMHPSSYPIPVIVSTTSPASENLPHLPVVPSPYPKPVMAISTSISIPRQEATSVHDSSPAAGNLYSKTNLVQHTLNTAQPKPSTTAMPVHSSGFMTQPRPEPRTYASTVKSNTVKDMEYIKKLIRDHGTEKQEFIDPIMPSVTDYDHIRNRELIEDMRFTSNPKFQKPCAYFNSPRGCRNGSHCPYQHDFSYQFPTGMPRVKRMRMSDEIFGR